MRTLSQAATEPEPVTDGEDDGSPSFHVLTDQRHAKVDATHRGVGTVRLVVVAGLATGEELSPKERRVRRAKKQRAA